MAINPMERKLRPIYEAWDCNNYKTAVNICNKLLKKEDLLVYKALKAVSLYKSGKPEEAISLCGEIKNIMVKGKDFQDPTVAQALCMVWKPAGMHNEICDIWNLMTALEPKNEEFYNHLFMGFVRCRNFKGQLEVAIKLNKLFKDTTKYFYWIVFINFLISTRDPTSINIALAERMMFKKDFFNGEELKLYLQILEYQNKYQEALEVFEKHQTSLKIDSERKKIKVNLLLKAGAENKEIVPLLLDLIKNDCDDWESIERYILLNEQEKEETIEEMNKLKGNLRGPYLALLKLDSLTISEYFEKFGLKNCCFSDIKPFLGKIPLNEREKLVEGLSNFISSGSNKVEQVVRDIFVTKVRFYFGLELTVAELKEKYVKSLDHDEKLEETQREYGDDYILIIAQLYIKESDYYSAIFVLEDALSRSKYNYDFKVFLINLYLKIGVCFPRVEELYLSLEIKNILHDTVSHYFVDFCRVFGNSIDTQRLLMSTMSIYNSNNVETPEMVCQAYRYGTFSKITEFMEFYDRLDKSFQKCVVELELNLNVFMMAQSYEDVEKVIEYCASSFEYYDQYFYSNRRDNRDFSICDWSSDGALFSLFNGHSRNINWLKYWHSIFNIVNGKDDKNCVSDDSFTKYIYDLSLVLKNNALAEHSSGENVWFEGLTPLKLEFEYFENISNLIIQSFIVLYLLERIKKICKKNKEIVNFVTEQKSFLKAKAVGLKDKIGNFCIPEIKLSNEVMLIPSVASVMKHSWRFSFSNFDNQLSRIIEMSK